MPNVKLKPCPRCGGRAELVKLDSGHWLGTCAENDDAESAIHWSWSEAAKLWNALPEQARCRMCGERTERPRTVYATAAVAPGVNVPGARGQEWHVCRSCYDLLDDDEAPDHA